MKNSSIMGRKAVRRREIQILREKYILQLLPVFYEFGLQALSMDDICAKLNVSKATLYNYFATKRYGNRHIVQRVLGEIAGFEKIIGSKRRCLF
ncbi:MAG: TetR/AcrR family transcriptional regulator [Chitinophagales bacterium]